MKLNCRDSLPLWFRFAIDWLVRCRVAEESKYVGAYDAGKVNPSHIHTRGMNSEMRSNGMDSGDVRAHIYLVHSLWLRTFLLF